jgi:hypothetical protein
MQIYKKKLRKKGIRTLPLFFVIISFFLFLSSCYKKRDTTLKVYVVNSNGTSVEGANVIVFGEPTDTSNLNQLSINFEKTTNKSGVAFFNFNDFYNSGQTGLAILKVKATYLNKTGQNTTQIEEEVDNECFVTIQ